MTSRVIIADDHKLVLEGLTTMIQATTDFDVMATVSNGKALLDLLSNLNQLPDVIIMDIDMPLMNGIDTSRVIKKTYPAIKILILTMHEESAYYNKLMAAHVDGFVTKNVGQNELLNALRNVRDGKAFFSDNRKSKKELAVLQEKEGMLTDREIEILKKISLGMSNTEISEELGISTRTVDTHRTNLKKKLSVTSIAGLVRYAIQQGYLS